MLIKREDIRALVNIIHNSGKTVVCTNGCFDILHVGHVRYLEATKAFADFSIVLLNSCILPPLQKNRPLIDITSTKGLASQSDTR